MENSGRLMYIDFSLNDRSYRLLNIYVPNVETDRQQFIKDIVKHIKPGKHLLVGGDFNCTLYNNDRRECGQSRQEKGRRELFDIMNRFDLIDIQKKRYPEKTIYT
jgi:exonuclease III